MSKCDYCVFSLWTDRLLLHFFFFFLSFFSFFRYTHPKKKKKTLRRKKLTHSLLPEAEENFHRPGYEGSLLCPTS